MTDIINTFFSTFEKYLTNSSIKLNENQKTELKNVLNLIIKKYNKNIQWVAPEQIIPKAIDAIYSTIPYIKDLILNEKIRVYWNRYGTHLHYNTEYNYLKKQKELEYEDPIKFYFKYLKEKLNKSYTLEKSNVKFKNIEKCVNDGLKQNLKPFIVKLIEDKNYSFITQEKYNAYIIRSNGTITNHPNVTDFNKIIIDFDDYSKGILCALSL